MLTQQVREIQQVCSGLALPNHEATADFSTFAASTKMVAGFEAIFMITSLHNNLFSVCLCITARLGKVEYGLAVEYGLTVEYGLAVEYEILWPNS